MPVPSPAPEHWVTLAVLAGGEGSRMGRPKANLQVAGIPILEYLLRQLHWEGPTLLITGPGREHPPGWEMFGSEAVDPIARQGPLRGILTAIEHARTPVLIATPVDMPCLQHEHLKWLLNELNQRPDHLGVLIRRLHGSQAEIESLPCVLRAQARPFIEEQIARHRRAIHSLLKGPLFDCATVPSAWPMRTWLNLNTPDDLREFERLTPNVR